MIVLPTHLKTWQTTLPKIKAAFGLSGIIGILWIIIGLIIYQPFGGLPLYMGFSVIGVLLIIIGILQLPKVIGVFEKG